MHEIVTIQIGQQANYIGTHFWNAQESYFTYGSQESPVNHDIHFRPGIGADGTETYTPRVLVYDLKDSFGTLKRENALYQLEEEANAAAQISQWPGQAQTLAQPAIPESPYQAALNSSLPPPQLTTSDVRYWSDYNHVFYHPRSLQPISPLSLTDSLGPFERYGAGEEVYRLLDGEHGLLDRDVRPWLEECDLLQGVQLVTGVDDAWGGFAGRLLEGLRDEVGKTGIWVQGLEHGGRTSRERQSLQLGNSVQAFNSLVGNASLYLPITSAQSSLPPYVYDLDPTSKWHTSALQVTALESLTLPARLRDSQKAAAKLVDFESMLSNDGKRKIAHLGLSVSAADDGEGDRNGDINGQHDRRVRAGLNGHARQGESDEDDSGTLTLDVDFTPKVPNNEPSSDRRRRSSMRNGKVFSQLQSLRGTFKSTLEIDDVNYSSRNRYSSAASNGLRLSCHQTPLLYPIPSSHPQIYHFDSSGPTRLDRVAVEATLTASAAVASRIRALERSTRSLIGVEDREALRESLLTVAEEYVEGWDSGSEDEASE